MRSKPYLHPADRADHRLCSFISNSMMLGLAAGGGSIYKIARSVRFNPPDSAYLARTPGSASNRRLWTFSAWVKRSNLGITAMLFNGNNGGSGSGTNNTSVYFSSTDQLTVNWSGFALTTNAVFRDPTAWLHLVVLIDVNNGTAALRGRIWVNGVELTSFSLDQRSSWSGDGWVNNTSAQSIGRQGDGSYYFDGYIAEVTFVDGQALTVSSFGETALATGAWVPKKFSGTYGTNGFRLDLSDNSGATSSTLGKDRSGNNNDWTPTNLSITAGVGNDSLTDTPTAYDDGTIHGNFCTFSPIDRPGGTRTNGNLDLSGSGNGNHATFYANSGKWVYEVTITASIVGSVLIGWSKADQNADPASSNPDGVFYFSNNGNKYVNSTSGAAYGASYANGDVIRCEMDFDNNQVQFFKNGTGQGTISWTKTANSFYSPHCYANSASLSANFGQRAFSGTPTSGFKSLSVQNLPVPTILKPAGYNNAVLDTGTGATKSVTGVGFQPDFVWRKSRSNATNHNIFDSVRGVQKGIVVNGTAVEYTDSATLTSFDSNGFSLGADGSSRGVNQSSHTYFTWALKKGATPALDIVTWTGNATNRTISHSLGVAPEFIIVRERDGVDDWVVYHKLADASPQSGYLLLNTTGSFTSDTTVWNNTAPSDSVFSVGTSNKVNENTKSYVAYVFAPVRGYSLMSSYLGNGNSDGPMVPCGFRPQLLLIKRISSGQPFILFDAVRNPFNVINNTIEADTTTIETQYGTVQIDFLAGGFKLRGSDAWLNASSVTYSFVAWAKLPVRYAPAA